MTDRNGGVINTTDHGELPFVWANVRRGLRLSTGQQVELEVANVGQPGQKAINVRTVQNQGPVSVDIRFGESLVSGNLLSLPCFISVARGKNPVVGTKVKLTANGTPDVTEPTTDAQGKVFFRTFVAQDSTQVDIEVEIDGKFYTAGWLNTKAKVKPELSVTESEGAGWKNFSIGYADGETLVPAVLTIRPSGTCRYAYREAGKSAWTTVNKEAKVSITGKTILQVKIVKLPKGVGGEDFFFGIDGVAAQSGPHYVSANA